MLKRCCFLTGLFMFAFSAASYSQIMATDSTLPSVGKYNPGTGFKLASSELGDLNFKLFTYLRYVNQGNIDDTYTDSFGKTYDIKQRQDFQINKVNLQFLGWILDPKLRYLFYAWTNNTAQGLGAQVVIGGNLQYSFNKHFTLGGGIGSLPGVRTTEGNFPYWLTLDNRYIAEEYFRPSYTTGIWLKGDITDKISYNVMLGNNLSQLGIDAGQLDNEINTYSGVVAWYPTTGEFGKGGGYGDFDHHENVATRVAVHYSGSREDRQGQPNSEAIENSQIRISDGNIIFQPGLFGAGVQVDKVTYGMTSFDAGAKYKGFSLEGGYYLRKVHNLTGPGTDTLSKREFKDTGFQLEASYMVLDKLLQAYVGTAQIFGEYGDPTEFRGGVNIFPWKRQVVRINLEWIQLKNSPVGYLSVPYAWGSNGGIFHADFMVNF